MIDSNDENTKNTVALNRDQLHLSFTTHYLIPMKDDFSNGNNNNYDQLNHQQLQPSLFYMERLATAVRFVQLLLEYREAVEPDDFRDMAIVPKVIYTTLSLQGDEDIQKLSLGVIGGMAELPARFVLFWSNHKSKVLRMII